MDGATDRVDLRGLSLLARCRSLRRDDAERAKAAARRAVEAALDTAEAADAQLEAHQRLWRETEATSLAAMAGHTLDGRRFRRMRDTLDAMADRAIALTAACRDARQRVTEAERAEAEARLGFSAAQRRLDQSNSIRDRAQNARVERDGALEEQELDDDLSQRFGRRT